MRPLLIAILLTLFTFSILSAQNAPGGVGNSGGTLGQPKNVIWYNTDAFSYANGASVPTFTDFSGNTNHATQATATQQPQFQTGQINGRPAVRFDNTGGAGNQDYMPFNGSLIVNSDYTVIFVGQRRSDSGTKFLYGGGGAGANANLHVYWNGSTKLHTHHYANDFNSNMIAASGGTTANTYGIFTSMLSSSESANQRRHYQNNQLLGSHSSAAKLGSYADASIGRYLPLNSYSDINMAEFIVYSSALNNAQLQIVNQYLNVKYNIAINNDLYNPSAPYVNHTVGIGSEDGLVKHSESANSGNGILLRELYNSLNEANEFVFASNDNAGAAEVISDLPSITPGSLTARAQRIWNLNRPAGTTTDISIGFALSDIGLGAGIDNQIFYLLYRSTTSGTFSEVPGAMAIVSNGQVWFNVENANLNDGYYTIARSDRTGNTWYSYNTGDWDNWLTWSLEAGGADIINPGHYTPSTSPTALLDKVVVLSPYVVTVNANGKQNAILEVRDGTVNFQSTTGHYFDEISGQGTIRLTADNFPDGSATLFNSAGGGTVEYNGAGHLLTTQRTFNHVKINLNNSSDVITQLANYSLNGNFTIEKGVYRINDDISNAVLNLNIAGNVDVSASGSWTVGEGNTIGTYSIPWSGAPNNMPALGLYHSIFHQVRIGGNLLNNGTIRFTNLSAPHYGQFASDGGVTLTFFGASDNTVELNSVAHFYNLIVDKGVDRTYILEINSLDDDNFKLFGPNVAGRITGGIYTNTNSEIRKALWIKTGTLKLSGFIEIPSLSEGNLAGGNGDYAIPGNACLWIAGSAVNNVRVFTTARTASTNLMAGSLGVNDASSNQALSVYGEFRITNGYLSTRNSAGFIFWSDASGVVKIEGGLCDVSQFRSGNGIIGGRTSFYMSGGDLYIRANHASFVSGSYTINTDGGGEIDSNYPAFGIIDTEGVFQMSGGTIYINQSMGVAAASAYNNGVYINAQLVNHNVTGGKFFINADGNQNIDLFSVGSLYDLEMSRLNAANLVKVHMGSDLTFNGSVIINANAELYARKQRDNFNSASYDLTIARGFTVNTGGDYRAINNTTTLLVTYSSGLNMNNTNQEFYNLVVKNNPNGLGVGYSRGFTGNANAVTVHNDLTIESGAQLIFNRVAGKDFIVKGNLTNSGTVLLNTPATNPSKIQLTQSGIVSGITLTDGGSYELIPTISFSAPGSGTTATAVPIFNGIPSVGNALPIAGILITNSGSGYTSAPTITFSSGAATATSSINTQHKIDGDGNGILANLEINEIHPSEAAGIVYVTYLEANHAISGKLTLTNGIFDLKAKKLRLDGTLASDVVSNYNTSKMLRTSGNHSDGGVERKIIANQAYLFPLGTKAPASYLGDANRYTPLNTTVSAYADDGYIQVNPVGIELPTLNAPGVNENALQYYWHVDHSGFTSVPQVNNVFLYDERDIRTLPNEVDYRIGKVIGTTRTNVAAIDAIGNTLNYPNTALEIADFTAAHANRFTGSVQIFYLRADGNWNNNATWSFTRGGAAATDYPKAGDIAIIRRTNPGTYSGHVTVTGTESAAKVVFDADGAPSSGCPRVIFNNSAAAYASNFNVVEVAETHSGYPLTGEAHGAVVQYKLFTGYAGEFPDGDFAGFYNYPNALVIYTNAGTTNPITLSEEATYYPQVWFDPPSAQTFILPNTEVTFNGMVIVTYGHILRMNSGANGAAIFKKRLNIGHSFGTGYFEMAGNATASQTVTAKTNINLYNSGQLRINNAAGGTQTHKILLSENITMETGCGINLGNGSAATSNTTLELVGNTSNTLTATGTATVNLSRLTMNKGASTATTFSFNWPFTITGPSNGLSHEKAIQLQNGMLVLNHASFNITLSSGGGNFLIPSTSGLKISLGTARVNATGSNGILLDGYLHVGGGTSLAQLILEGGTDNFIEYSSSGKAEIQVRDYGKLQVGSQIRSSTLNNLGVLKFLQSGSGNPQTIVGMVGAPTNTRGLFEIMNPGSRFQLYNGKLIVARTHDVPATATRAALYLDPSTVGVNEWGAIQIGLPATTPAGSVIKVNAVPTICDFTVDGNATALLDVNSLSVLGEFEVISGAAFNGNNLNVSLQRNITNGGPADLHTDTLYFVGDAQLIRNGNITVDNMMVNPMGSVTLNGTTSLVTINQNLHINSGQLGDNGQTILLKGDLFNEAYHVSTGAGRLKMAGTSLQHITGFGQYGTLELDNVQGARLMNELSLDNDFYLTNGRLELQSHQLELSENSDIIGSGYNSGKMIASNGSFSNMGLKKNIPSGALNFNFPIGMISGAIAKYTPVEFEITSNTHSGSIRINPVNQAHMTTIGPNVLQYYWTIASSGISGFNADMKLYYQNSDVVGPEVDYISARLVDNYWSKFPIETVDEAQDTILFSHVGVNTVSGDYTAGIDPHIPAEIPIFESTKNSVWTDTTAWVRLDGFGIPMVGGVPAGGPNGHHVRILAGHTILMDRYRILSYRTEIFGRLEVGTDVGHNLGYVSGTGTLALVNEKMPVANLTAFLASGTNSTVEWGGNAYTVPDITPNGSANIYNNLTFTGNGLKTLPAMTYTVRKNLNILSTTQLKTQYTFYLAGHLNLESTAGVLFAPGYYFRFNGTANQNVTGDYTGTNEFKRLLTSNPTSITFSDHVNVLTYLNLQNGHLNMPLNKSITLKNTTLISLVVGVNAYINGRFVRRLANGSTGVLFPVAKSDMRRFVRLNSVAGSGVNPEYWGAEYFYQNPTDVGMDTALKNSPVQKVSGQEYWYIDGNGTATASLDWGAESGISDITGLLVVEWNGSSWISRGAQTITSTSPYLTGTILAQNSSSFSTGVRRGFTIGTNTLTNPLPVDLITFDAQLVDKKVLLNWETSSETNNDFFTIERSYDGEYFEEIGTVEGAGNANVSNRYELWDENPLNGTIYYRLKQTDFDGIYRHIAIDQVSIEGQSAKLDVMVYPNPASKFDYPKIQIQNFVSHSEIQFVLYDVLGKVCYNGTLETDASGFANSAIEPQEELPTGIYVLTVTSGKDILKKTIVIE